MKRRIIGMILVVVMLTLTLVGCGYSFKDDNMSKYATFSEEDKAAFLAALEKIAIEDGDFTTDPEVRKNKVVDFIYQNIMASAADSSNKKTEGVPGVHDKVYYFYYTTADFDGTVAVLEVANMKTASANLLLGMSDYGDDNVKTAIAAGLSSIDFKDKILKTVTSGKAVTGDIAYVEYSYSYYVTDAAGVKTEKSGKAVNQKIVVGTAEEKPTSLSNFIAGKDIGKDLGKVVIPDAQKGDVSYSDFKINWTANTDLPAFTFTDVTYTETKTFTDTENLTRDVKDKLLTYHIFPSYYIPTPEYTTANLIDLYYGDKLTVDNLYALILGEDYANLDEKEDKDKIEERANLIKDYKSADGDSVEAFVEKLKTLYTDIADADKSRETAATDLSGATQTRDDAKTKLDDAKAKETPDEKEIAELETLLAKAEENLTKATEANKKAHDLHESKKAEKDNYIKAFLESPVKDETFDALLNREFKEATYKSLQEDYNETIRMNLAKEVYFFLTEYVKLSDKLPEDAVKMAYESMIENYETEFHTGDYTETQSNYNKYKSFDKYLVQAVSDDYKTVKTAKEAKEVLKEQAAEYVKPLVQIYLAAEVFELTVSDKEYKEYKKDPESEYDYNVYTYGENSVLHAYQLDKLLDYFVEFEESEPVLDANGYEVIKYNFKKIGAYEFGTPKSKAPKTAE